MSSTPKAHNIILSYLSKVKRVGDGKYMASCPCHTDKTPSLSIKIDTDQTILMHCFSCGANGVEICAAIGIDQTSLFPPGDGNYRRQDAIGFSSRQLVHSLGDDLVRLLVIANEIKNVNGISEDDRRFVADIAAKVSRGLDMLEGRGHE